MSACGGTTISAGLADSQSQLDQAIGVGGASGADTVAQFAHAYRASGGGPTLAFLGFNPFQIVATGGFHELYWSAIVIFIGVMTVLAMQNAIRHTVRGRYPLDSLAQVYFRLAAGIIIIGNLPLFYALLMTLNGVASQGVRAMATQSMSRLFQTGSFGTLALAQARMEAIRTAAARRTMALYPNGASRDEMAEIGNWYNAMARAINPALMAQNAQGQLPMLDDAVWTNAQTPDDRVASYVGRHVVQNFGQMVADLGALQATGQGGLSIAFPSGASTSLTLLSSALADDDAQAAQVLSLPNTPSSNAQFEAARQIYAKNVMADSLNYLDTRLLSVIGASPTLAQRTQAWFSEKVEQAAAAATGFLTDLRATVDWLGRGIGITLTRVISFFFTAAIKVVIEVELFVLVLAMPLWLLPATEDAFCGVLRALFALAFAAPAYQFIMLFVDALMGLILNYALFGPLAVGGGNSLKTAGGAVYMALGAFAAIGSGGEAIALFMFCYLVAYLFLAIYAAVKTPKLIALFLKGAGAAGAFLSTFATGLIAGAATALASATVGGSGLAGRLLGAGHAGIRSGSGGSRPTAGPPQSVYSVDRSSAATSASDIASRPSFGPFLASTFRSGAPVRRPASQGFHRHAEEKSPEVSAPAPRRSYVEAAGFGLRTLADCLRANSPGDGLKIALRGLDEHRKQREKASEAQYKLQRKMDKPDK